MPGFEDAIRILGAERDAEIRACVGEVLQLVLANRQRYCARPAEGASAQAA